MAKTFLQMLFNTCSSNSTPPGELRLSGMVESSSLRHMPTSTNKTPSGILSLWLLRGEVPAAQKSPANSSSSLTPCLLQDLRVSPDDDGKAPVGGILPGRVDLDPYAVVSLGEQVLHFFVRFNAASC
jgi:hypothetical protein